MISLSYTVRTCIFMLRLSHILRHKFFICVNNEDNPKLVKEKKNMKMNIIMIKIDNDAKDLYDNGTYLVQNEAGAFNSTLT